MRSTLILLISLLFWTHSLVQPVFSQTITSSSGEGTQVETSESAETEEQAPEESIAEPETWGGVLDSTEQALTREGLTDEELDLVELGHCDAHVPGCGAQAVDVEWDAVDQVLDAVRVGRGEREGVCAVRPHEWTQL